MNNQQVEKKITILGPKFVKPANMWVVTEITDDKKDLLQKQTFFITEKEAKDSLVAREE